MTNKSLKTTYPENLHDSQNSLFHGYSLSQIIVHNPQIYNIHQISTFMLRQVVLHHWRRYRRNVISGRACAAMSVILFSYLRTPKVNSILSIMVDVGCTQGVVHCYLH